MTQRTASLRHLGGIQTYLSDETAEGLREGLARGMSIRPLARKLGISKATVSKFARVLPRGLCGCGSEGGHRGWCWWRFRRSPLRQAVIRRLHGVPPERWVSAYAATATDGDERLDAYAQEGEGRMEELRRLCGVSS